MPKHLRPGAPPRSRYMIAPAKDAHDLVDELKADPEITVLRRGPTMLIVEMSDSHAEMLRGRHKGKATIELDAPLNPSKP